MLEHYLSEFSGGNVVSEVYQERIFFQERQHIKSDAPFNHIAL